MLIHINDEPMHCTPGISITALLTELGQLKPGVALALNEQIVARERWESSIVQDSDRILLFQVIAGG